MAITAELLIEDVSKILIRFTMKMNPTFIGQKEGPAVVFRTCNREVSLPSQSENKFTRKTEVRLVEGIKMFRFMRLRY